MTVHEVAAAGVVEGAAGAADVSGFFPNSVPAKRPPLVVAGVAVALAAGAAGGAEVASAGLGGKPKKPPVAGADVDGAADVVAAVELGWAKTTNDRIVRN